MAWNEPGGGDKDPWGNRGDQGPPDLDEAFRKLQDQLSGIFGGGGGGGDRSGKGISGSAVTGLVLVATVIYFLFGLYQIDEQERGVVLRFGALQEEVVAPGLHWNPPIVDRVIKVNVTQVQSHDHQALMLTEDENIVDVTLTVQWVVNNAKNFVVQVREPQASLEHATESALRHVVGSSQMDPVLTDGREAIGLEVHERVQAYLDRYQTGISVSKVNIDETAPPSQVRDAFDDVQKAKEDEQRVINEANAFAESVVPQARGQAQKQIEQANAYRDQVIARAEGEAERFEKLLVEFQAAEQVTRDRLYIDAMETVLGSSSKILVDVQGGNNLLYLPLDRITQGPSNVPQRLSDPSATELTIESIRDYEARQLPGRSRDTR